MQITCLGAARCVTGSCFLIDNGNKYLIDCGLFQGGKLMEALNHQEWKFNPRDISALFLTHAHIDHCGRIPKLVKDGFRGKIYTSLPTSELAKILLLDSGHIQEMESEWQSRKNRRRGLPGVEPLYTVADAEACMGLFETVSNDEVIPIAPDLKVCFRNAGHILGSSILEIWSGGSERPCKVVFSGDLGHKDQLIVRDPSPVAFADMVFVESTYGNRNHKSLEESQKELLEAIRYSYQHKEKVIIPAFAVARAQEIIYLIGKFFRKGLIPSMPVYLDSPLAIAATDIFRRMSAFYDDELRVMVGKGQDPLDFPQLILSHTAQESMAINEAAGPAIVIAGNGMCTAGRIKHHLKHNIWRQGSSLVIVGFQAEGTLGRKIIEGTRTIRILGEKISVRAKVFTIGGFSAHADQSVLLEWLGHFKNPNLEVFVVHGEQSICEGFATLAKERFGYKTHAPALGDTIRLVPAQPEGVREAGDKMGWEQHLDLITRKVDMIRRLWQDSPEVFPAAAMQRLEKDLAGADQALETILKEMKEKH